MFHLRMIGRRSTVNKIPWLLAFAYSLTTIVAICHAPPPAFAEGDVNEQVTKTLDESAPAPTLSPATIFVARKVITMEPSNPSGDAVAISGKRIVAAGRLEDVKKALGDRPFVVDETTSDGFTVGDVHWSLGTRPWLTLDPGWADGGWTASSDGGTVTASATLTRASDGAVADGTTDPITFGYVGVITFGAGGAVFTPEIQDGTQQG